VSGPQRAALRIDPDRSSPVELRRALEQRGPTFIKLGQFLALRPDLLPQAYCDELLSLTDDVAPFPFERAQQIIEEELAGSLESFFGYVNPRPLAAASLAQVHEARTPDGREVVIKVQRDDITAALDRDLRDPSDLRRLLATTGLIDVVSLPALVGEFRRFVSEELDLRLEAENMARMGTLMARTDSMRVPRPLRNLSGRRVLTSERLRGVPFSELLRLARAGERERITALGLDPDALAGNLIHAIYTQIFRYELFHADPHPGNLIALANNVVGFVDLGFVDTLGVGTGEGLTTFLSGIYAGDLQSMLAGLLQVLERSEDANVDGFRSAFVQATETMARDRGHADRGRASSPVRDYMVTVLQAARENGLRIPARLLAIYRALLMAETVAHSIGSTRDLITEGRRFFGVLQVERFLEGLLDPKRTFGLALDLVALLRDGPGQLQRVLAELAEERFVLRATTAQSPVDRHQANTRARMLAAAIVSVTLAVITVGFRSVHLGPVPISGVFMAFLFAALVGLLLLWNRLS
jgi:ubiquinone biosynthesis protein